MVVFFGKKVTIVTQASPITSTRRSQRGQSVCQIHRPNTTGRVKNATTICPTNGHPRNICQAVSNTFGWKTRAAPKPSHNVARMMKAE